AADEACRQAATYREERDAALRGQTEAARLSKELDAERSAVAGLHSELQELRQAQAALDAAQAEGRTVAQQLEQRQGELEQARPRLSESEAALEHAAAAAQQRDEALAERDRLRAEAGHLRERAARADALEKDLDAERSSATGLRSELQTFQTQAEATQKPLAKIRCGRDRAVAEAEPSRALL